MPLDETIGVGRGCGYEDMVWYFCSGEGQRGISSVEKNTCGQ